MITLHVIVTNIKITVKVITGRGRGFEIGQKLITVPYRTGCTMLWCARFYIRNLQVQFNRKYNHE